MQTTLERIHEKIADLETKISHLRIAERELLALDKVAARQTKVAPTPAPKAKQKPGPKPASRKTQTSKPLASKAAEPRQSLAAAISEVLDQHGALSAAEISERINAAGREVNNRSVSFALQGLKKRGLAKNTGGKWSVGKARGRRAGSTSGVSAVHSEAAE
jgi:ribosomal protein L9